MGIFSANPSSFKMDKNTLFASELKVSIADKLKHFLVNYTDDVLSEYIVVLICNGKDQFQARDELDAFLGELSEEFVSWLWSILLKSADQSHVPMVPSYREEDFRSGTDGFVKDNCSRHMWRGVHGHAKVNANMLSNDEREYYPSAFAPPPVSLNDNEVSEDSPRSFPRSSTFLNENNDIERHTQLLKCKIPPKTGPTDDRYSEVLKHAPSRVKVSSGISAGSEQNLLYLDENKIVRSYSDGLSRQCLCLPTEELPFIKLKSATREYPKYEPSMVADVAERRLSSGIVDSVSCQNARSRASVWDRLGKPRDDNRVVRMKNTEVRGADVVKRRIVEHPGEAHVKNGGRFCERFTGEFPAPDNTSDKFNKRHFGELDSSEKREYRQLEGREPLKEFRRSSSANHSRSESYNSISRGTRQTGRLHTYQASGTSDSAFIPRVNIVPQRTLSGEALEVIPHTLVSNRLVMKSEPVSNEDATKANLKPANSTILYVKSRLLKIETEMSKLKAKHLESNEGKPEFLSSSGACNPSDNNVDARTIFVTNVHFAATKEALSLHFAKCGMVVKVIILNDVVSTQPKGAAYITFAQKDSAEKAVALSGTSFWSRTLKVVRKVEMPAVTSAPSWPVRKSSWSQSLQPNRKVILPRPCATSLQWRRDQPVSTEGLSSGIVCGLEASGNIEQNCNRPVSTKGPSSASFYGLEASGTIEQNCNELDGHLHNVSSANTSSSKVEAESWKNPGGEECNSHSHIIKPVYTVNCYVHLV